MTFGEIIESRLAEQIARFGQTYTYTRGASTTTITARISVMSTTTKYAWFTSAEVAAWTAPQAPAYVVTIAGDFQPFGGAVVAGTDLVTIAGADYLVRKLDRPRLGATVIKTVLYCAR